MSVSQFMIVFLIFITSYNIGFLHHHPIFESFSYNTTLLECYLQCLRKCLFATSIVQYSYTQLPQQQQRTRGQNTGPTRRRFFLAALKQGTGIATYSSNQTANSNMGENFSQQQRKKHDSSIIPRWYALQKQKILA